VEIHKSRYKHSKRTYNSRGTIVPCANNCTLHVRNIFGTSSLSFEPVIDRTVIVQYVNASRFVSAVYTHNRSASNIYVHLCSLYTWNYFRFQEALRTMSLSHFHVVWKLDSSIFTNVQVRRRPSTAYVSVVLTKSRITPLCITTP